MKLTAYGRREWRCALAAAAALIAVLCVLYGFNFIPDALFFPLLGLIVLAALAHACIFRDPGRRIPGDPALILSPADGTIHDIELIKSESIDSDELRGLFQGRDMLRIGIAVSLFNVRILRAPCAMRVVFLQQKKNASVLIGAEGNADAAPRALAVCLISHAARIVCPISGDPVFAAGEKFGMIRHGARAELYLPAGTGFELAVKVGDTATGGTTPLARITAENHNQPTQAKTADETPQK